MSKYTTGELARLCGVSVRTVQYYDTRGILVPSELSEGGRRLYSENDLDRMRIICFLRELDLPLDSIARLLQTDNAGEVISLVLEEQEMLLREEVAQKQAKLERIAYLRRCLGQTAAPTVESIGDIAHIMERKNQMKRLHGTLLLAGIPMSILQWAGILLWIFSGIWWLFAVYAMTAVPFAIGISRYYFRRVEYVCPQCHTVFKPRMWQAFWANHTPTTRRLTCKSCGYRGFCVETYREHCDEGGVKNAEN